MAELEQKLSISPALVFVIKKHQNLTYDLTLTRELSTILKSYDSLRRFCGELSNVAARGSIRPLVLELGGGGGGSDPRPMAAVSTEISLAVPGEQAECHVF